ncbi:MAG: ATP-binding protein, partial [Myxococcota bacterium]
GAVRRRGATGTYFVATAVLDQLPQSPVGQWLAARTLAALSGDLAAFARLCAVLGRELAVAEIEWVQRRAEREGGPGSRLDTWVGLEELTLAGLLQRVADETFVFADSLARDGIYGSIAARARTTLHRYALDFARARGDLLGVARHGAVCGAGAEAAAAYLALGERAHSQHQHVAADQHLTRAIELAGAIDDGLAGAIDDGLAGAHPVLGPALLGRGRARYHLHRITEAVGDLQRAAELAAHREDVAGHAAALLELATAHDWAYDFERSAAAAERAGALLSSVTDPALHARYQVALGRTHWRREQPGAAVATLDQAVARARACGETEAEIVARLLLPLALVITGELDRAERDFAEVIELCRTAEDWMHLAAAYANRLFLWEARGLVEPGLADLRASIQAAREAGFPILEAGASYNLAELLFWRGDDEQSLTLARRSHLLQDRFVDPPPAVAPLLLARIHAARGEDGLAEHYLAMTEDRIGTRAATPTERILTAAVRRSKPWSELLTAARELPVEEALE